MHTFKYFANGNRSEIRIATVQTEIIWSILSKHLSFTMFSFLLLVSVVSVGVINGAAEDDEAKVIPRHKRQLPLKLDCNVLSTATRDRCYKGDLIDESIADCKKTSLFVTCDPINKDPFSSD